MELFYVFIHKDNKTSCSKSFTVKAWSLHDWVADTNTLAYYDKTWTTLWGIFLTVDRDIKNILKIIWLICILHSGKSYWRERLSTVDLLVLTSLDLLVFKLKIIFSFFTKQATLMRRSTVLSLPPQLVFPGWGVRHWERRTEIKIDGVQYFSAWPGRHLCPKSLHRRRDHSGHGEGVRKARRLRQNGQRSLQVPS